MSQENNRRHFLQQSGMVAAGLYATSVNAKENREPIRVAVIGCGGMGSGHLRELASRKDVRVEYVCDPDKDRLARAAKTAEGLSKHTPKTTNDFREVLKDKSVRAVWIATPDHWHGPAAILACEAKKHVYVEKPCSHNIREGRLMLEAARRNKCVMQVGTQSRSTEHVQKAMQLLKEGVIGDILVAKAWNSQRRGNIGHQKPRENPPANLDYDLWVGPAPMVPFQANRHHYTWHWWYDFGTGDMGNDGVHDIDIARWGLGVETHPTNVSALGGKYFFDDDQQFPDTQYVVFEYPGKGKVGERRQLIYEHRIWSPYRQSGHENGNEFYGTKGMMTLGKNGGWQIFHERNKPGPSMKGSVSVRANHDNFLECIHSGKRPNADIEIGHLSATLCHLGNLASRFGTTLEFDPEKETITNHEEAAKLVTRKYREGHWAIPS